MPFLSFGMLPKDIITKNTFLDVATDAEVLRRCSSAPGRLEKVSGEDLNPFRETTAEEYLDAAIRVAIGWNVTAARQKILLDQLVTLRHEQELQSCFMQRLATRCQEDIQRKARAYMFEHSFMEILFATSYSFEIWNGTDLKHRKRYLAILNMDMTDVVVTETLFSIHNRRMLTILDNPDS